MNRFFYAFGLIIFFSHCSPIPKFQLPSKGTPPLITYSKVVKAETDKVSNYKNVLKRIHELVPDAKIKIEDTFNNYFQVVCYAPYKYKTTDHKCSYVVSFQGEDSECRITINQLRILHYNIERIYFDEKRKTAKRLNPSFEEINTRLNSVINDLASQIQ